MLSALRSWLVRPASSKKAAPTRTRLGVESMEDRVVLTTGWVGLDGGYKDVLNGLVWFKESTAPGGPGHTSYTFMADWAANSTRNGYDDWRLPDLDETRRAVANDVYYSLEDPGWFKQWTSTEYDRKNVWCVDLEGEWEETTPKSGWIMPSWGMVRDSANYVDDGGAGFATSGAWSPSSAGYLGDSRTAAAGDGSTMANWTFSGLEVGETYRVATTWAAAAGAATNAPFDLLDGGLTEATRAIDQSAAPDDYRVQGTAWEMLGDVTVDSGQLTVRLSNLANGTVAADALRIFKVSGTPVLPRLYVGDASVVEGASGTSTQLAYTVTRSGDTSQAVTVDYATGGGTATAGTDYEVVGGTITFGPDETSKVVSVTVYGDAAGEPNETVLLTLSNATGATIGTGTGGTGAAGTGVGTVVNDDPALSINDVRKQEGRSGVTYFTFTVTLSAPAPAGGVSVNWATANGTAADGSDYKAASGTLYFAAGQTTATITVEVSGDRTKEANETFFVNLSDAVGADLLDGQGLGTIVNDD